MDKTKVRSYIRCAIGVLVSMVAGSLITIFIKDENYIDKEFIVGEHYKEFAPLYETYETIKSEYYKEIDEKTLVEGAISGMLESIGDKHTMYFDEKSKADFDAELSGSYYGIGAQIQLTTEGTVKIIKIFDGSPAEKSGLKVNDVFVSIDGTSTEGMNADDVATRLKSDSIKTSKIVISRDGKELTFNVTKANVTMFSVSSEMISTSNKKIGYVSVSIFGQRTYSQFAEAINKLEREKMDSLIIDLRGNTGGYLYTVTSMLEMFIEKGNVIYKMQTNEGIEEFKTMTSSKKDYKIVILIDEYSASASEIMAAAMKEQYSAILVGKTTYGKGTVQATKDLSDGTMIKYTIEKWLTPSGKNIDGEGINPDYDVTIGEEYHNNPTRENDTQLQKALELLK